MSNKPAAIIVGEVLWDCFSERDGGRRILGGAPLNVAWNLAGLGLDPLFISAVGDDELGHEILARMKAFGMSTTGIAVVPGVPTGTVQVTMIDGEPHYEIVKDVAWDQIPRPDASLSEAISERLAASHRTGNPALFYHGSLACRDERSRSTIVGLRDLVLNDPIDTHVFFDVNLRAPHYERSTLDLLRKSAAYIKLNLDELAELSDGIRGDAVEQTMAAGRSFEQDPDQVPLSGLLVTRGSDGALCYTPGCSEPLQVHSPAPEEMIDPVGAGDAFAAVVMHGILAGRPFTNSLHDAVAFASKVCGLAGATCDIVDFYKLPSC
ncbi:carbohydrate kinase family protein [Allorhodopirellula heiligendammensis]|uniref:5-dehydro-2-deoxygluconokinase n=1 Tax=Allorhodopirellula heiligendammensis TaxID=2714739 RepID=A0A5C6C3B6_9BACT|nr:carbohydrate kinase [Allorhodopirellula heiligendammensis]TWU18111.1 5-dehydro-2-deoxygluconokinase [Allorhodopirellula heiligendammensis]